MSLQKEQTLAKLENSLKIYEHFVGAIKTMSFNQNAQYLFIGNHFNIN